METTNTRGFTPDLSNPDPASHRKELARPIGKVYENRVQFDEAVQRLLEEFEKHPKTSADIFY